LTGFILVSGLSACSGGATDAPTGGGNGEGNGDSSGDGRGDEGDGDSGGDPLFVTPFRILDVEDPNAVYATLEADRNTVFGNSVFTNPALGGLSSYADVTAPANQPPSGSLDYAEYLLIFLGNNDFSVGANVTGEASLSVLLANQSISGEAASFPGKPNDENGSPQVVNYLCTIAITDGSMTQDTNGRAAIAIDIDGTLDDAVNTFVVNNTLSGLLYGANGEGLNARQTGTAMDSTINGGATSYDQATLRAQLCPKSKKAPQCEAFLLSFQNLSSWPSGQLFRRLLPCQTTTLLRHQQDPARS
jgi:hypothetical protein